MDDLKYIYYEIKYIAGENSTEETIENENVLMIKPHTNSNGIWGFRNCTKRHNCESYSYVEQNWIDLEKFKNATHDVWEKDREYVKKVLKLLDKKLRWKKINNLIKGWKK